MGIFFIKVLARIPRSSCFHAAARSLQFLRVSCLRNGIRTAWYKGQRLKALVSAHLMLHDDVKLGWIAKPDGSIFSGHCTCMAG